MPNLPRFLKTVATGGFFEIQSAPVSAETAIEELAKKAFEAGAMASGAHSTNLAQPTTDQMKALISIANNFWRAKKRMSNPATGEVREEMQRVHERVEAIRRSLAEFGIVILYASEGRDAEEPPKGITIRDHTRDIYDEGQPMEVVACKPVAGLQEKRVSETMLPSIFWNDRLIQNGQIEIATPCEEAESKG